MKRIQKTVFISYRRTNFPWAYCIYQDLTHHGFDVFYDYQGIDSGSFEKVILENIKARAHFIVILAPSALEKCSRPNDWLRREIETALDEGRNIIPVMLGSFDFGSPLVKESLTGKLALLGGYNGMSLISEYMEAGLEKLRTRFLNVALEDVYLHRLAEDAREITATQQAAANEAPPVEKEELTAQEWYEKGYVFADNQNFSEAIRCYSEAIRLRPDLAEAHNNRGNARREVNDLQGALADYDEAIRLKPDLAVTYYNRGLTHRLNENLEDAASDYEEAIRRQSDRGVARIALTGVLRTLGRNAEADEQEKLARELITKENEYDQACFEANCGNVEKALELLKIALEKEPSTKAWAQRDPDFESIRDNPRFKELVGL